MIPTINHFIGQADVIARFRVALEAAWNDATALPHMLFVGPPGVGKTQLAVLSAKEMAVRIHETIAQTLQSTGAVNALLLAAEDREIVFIDEIHELQPHLQTTLYRAMEDRQVFLRGRNDTTHNMPLKNISVLASSTDQHSLLNPLQDRFKLILPFTFYDTESLTRIALQRASLMGINIDEQVAEQIARRAKGTPRIVIKILESCHRFARSKGDAQVAQEHFEATIQLEGLDSLGLGRDEQRYLGFLVDRQEPTRLSTLESALGIHRRTLQSVIEPFLLRAGLIERSDKGREITEAGREHLKSPIAERIETS